MGKIPSGSQKAINNLLTFAGFTYEQSFSSMVEHKQLKRSSVFITYFYVAKLPPPNFINLFIKLKAIIYYYCSQFCALTRHSAWSGINCQLGLQSFAVRLSWGSRMTGSGCSLWAGVVNLEVNSWLLHAA